MKEIVGLVEKVKIIGRKGSVETLAKFDTGATDNSLDYKIAAMAGAGHVISSVRVKSASASNGYVRRPVIEASIEIGGKRYHTKANLEDRDGLRYKVLIGRVLLKKFLIDVEKNNVSDEESSLKKRFLKEAGLKIGDVKFTPSGGKNG